MAQGRDGRRQLLQDAGGFFGRFGKLFMLRALIKVEISGVGVESSSKFL